MKTTLKKISEYHLSKGGLEKLLAHLGKTGVDDEPLLISTVLDSNGLRDALLCLKATTGYEKELRLFAVKWVRRVQHLMPDKQSRDALDVAERYAHGLATKEELDAAGDAAWDAVCAAESDTARNAARNAAYAAAHAVAGDAAWYAACAAALAAESDAVYAAEEKCQEQEFRAMLKSIKGDIK